MKKICLLLNSLFVVLTLLSGPLAAPLSAQPVTVGKLTVYGDNTLSFDIAWGPGARTAPWSDSVWVLIDYKDAGGELLRLPIASATLTAVSSTWPLARVRTVPGNTAGVFVDGQARALGAAATLTLRVVPELPAGATINKPCAYALDYPPLATYGVDSGDNTVALVGTAPFCGIIVNSSGGTMTFPSSEASWTLPTGFRVGSYTDLTGNSGLVDCAAALPTVTGSSGALRCGSGVVTLSATPSAGATIDWYSAATGGTLLLSANTAYSPSVSTSTTYYAQARNTGTQCTSASRTAVVATMYPSFNPGAIAATGQTLCAGGTPALISSATAASGGDGVITYSWYKNGTLIADATAANYTPSTADAAANTATSTLTITYTRRAKDNTCNTTPVVGTGAWNMGVLRTPPKPTITAGALTVCSGTTTTISLPDWYGLPNVNEKNYHIPGIVWARTANVVAGTYNGQVQSPEGCWSAYSDVVTITAATCTGGGCNYPVLQVGTTTWAGCNSTYTGGAWVFAARPDTYTPFVQWNKPSTGWPATGSSTYSNWTSGTSTSASWTNGFPCPAGWRLPAQAEFEALHNAGTVWRAAGASGYNNAVAGRFYGSGAGTCSLPAPSNCIFLPASGYRANIDGTLRNQDSAGSYWASAQYDSAYGYALTFTSSLSDPAGNFNKPRGFSARCVK